MSPIVVLKGYIVNNNEYVKLICDSDEESFRNSATFLVNDEIREYIKLIGDECIGITGQLCDNLCGCNSTSKILFLNTSEFSPGTQKFGCKMRFQSVDLTTPVEVESSISFNGSDFVQLSNRKIEKDTNVRIPDTQSLSFIAGVIAPVIVLILLIIGLCLFTRLRKKGQDKINKEEQTALAELPVAETTASCSTCKNVEAIAYCPPCKGFLCKNCKEIHKQKYNEHNINGMSTEDINEKHIKELCDTNSCNNGPKKICYHCRHMYCENCFNGHSSAKKCENKPPEYLIIASIASNKLHVIESNATTKL